MTRAPRRIPGPAPTIRPTRRRQALNLLRNLWYLRRELWALVRRRKPEQQEAIPLVCIACKHDLTKPCIRGRTRHMIRWPEGIDGHEPGAYVEVARQKPRGGRYIADHDLRAVKR